MSRTVLKVEYNYDFYLLGLVSPIKDYRLCWVLNKDCGMNFVKQADLEINSKQNKKLVYFSVFEYTDEVNHSQYNVIANKRNGEYLIPERKEADYFFMIRGYAQDADKKDLLKAIRSNPEILAAFEVDPAELRSKQNLVLE